MYNAGNGSPTPTTEQFERVMALSDAGAFPRKTAIDLLRTLKRDQLEDILPSQEYLHRAITRARRSADHLQETTMRLRMAALELVWLSPSYAA